ncbi:MAG: hypothetical protein ACRDRX_04705 [Pseudonocardiaceae bacterium]
MTCARPGFSEYAEEGDFAAQVAELDQALDAILTPSRTSGPDALRGITLPNERYLTQTGETFDGLGIPPDIREPVFTEEELTRNRDSAFDRARAVLGSPIHQVDPHRPPRIAHVPRPGTAGTPAERSSQRRHHPAS